MESFLFHFVNTILVSGALYLLYRASGKKVPVREDGFFILRMQKAYLYGGIFSFLLGMVGMAIPFASEDFSTEVLLSSTAILVLFGGIGFYMILLYRNHFVQFNEELMVVQNPWGHSINAFYSSVKSARYSSLSGSVVFTLDSGNKISVHEHLVGFPQLIKHLRKVNGDALINIR